MANFEHYIPFLFKWEGKLGTTTNNKNDKGGWTNAGVTLKTFRDFFGQDKSVDDLRAMTMEQWRKIARSYWDECKADKINNQSIAELVVDWNFNSGVTGRKEIQKVFNLVADGIYGPKTLAALNGEPQKCVFCKIKDARENFFRRLASNSTSQANNLKGWLNRLNDFNYETI